MCPISSGYDTQVVVGIPQGKLARSRAKVTGTPVLCSLSVQNILFNCEDVSYRVKSVPSFVVAFTVVHTSQSALCDTFTIGSTKQHHRSRFRSPKCAKVHSRCSLKSARSTSSEKMVQYVLGLRRAQRSVGTATFKAGPRHSERDEETSAPPYLRREKESLTKAAE